MDSARRRRTVALWLLLTAACEPAPSVPKPAPAPDGPAAPAEESRAAAAAAPAPSGAAKQAPADVQPPQAGEEVRIPAGRIHLGSLPGTPGRDPSREADAIAVEVPAFYVDRLPHPNDPQQPPTRRVDRSTAAKMCAEQGKRLCHEIEWERACKGDDTARLPTVDDSWSDPPCGADGLRCASPHGVLRMGTGAREWTASQATPGLGDTLRTAVVRGAAADAAADAHRCAARDSATPDSRSTSLGFRCCRGPAPSGLRYPSEPAREPFELLPMSTEETRALIRGWPEVAELAASFVPFRGDDYATALHKGGRTRDGILPWIPVEHPLLWSPVHGERVLVLTGKTDGGAVLLFAYQTQDGRRLFGGSFELSAEPDPVVVAFNPERRDELLWTSCWGCGGEGGAIELRDDGRVLIVQR